LRTSDPLLLRSECAIVFCQNETWVQHLGFGPKIALSAKEITYTPMLERLLPNSLSGTSYYGEEATFRACETHATPLCEKAKRKGLYLPLRRCHELTVQRKGMPEDRHLSVVHSLTFPECVVSGDAERATTLWLAGTHSLNPSGCMQPQHVLTQKPRSGERGFWIARSSKFELAVS
jgi:hypothetical protein